MQQHTKRQLSEAVRALESIYEGTVDRSPSETVDRFLEAVETNLAKTTVAILIKRNAWDGRISQRSKTWAYNFTDEDAEIYTTIHKAHLDQIAQELAKA